MTLTTAAWLAMAAYSLHIMEEHSFDWRNWARDVIKLPVEWPDFYVTNATVVAVGIAQAMLASSMPLVSLGFTGLMLINALFFHFLPSIVCSWSTALSTGAADIGTIVLGVVLGAVLMAYPVVMLRLRSLPYFQQVRHDATH